VDIALDAQGNAYVTDTWNQRIQVFTPDASRQVYTASVAWDVMAWSGNGLDNKPFITVDAAGTISVTDPEMCRVISFSRFHREGSPCVGWLCGRHGLPVAYRCHIGWLRRPVGHGCHQRQAGSLRDSDPLI